jgi:CheY-like chemotaxis protein
MTLFHSAHAPCSGVDCVCLRAYDGKDALASIEHHQTIELLVLLDLKKPHMDGFEVLGWLQTQTFRVHFIVTVLSGSDYGKDIERPRALGAIDYVVKTITAAAIKESMARREQMLLS